jgi:hypothetical protein
LEKANLYVTTNLRKLQPELSEINDVAYANMKKGTDIWQQTLATIDYKNSNADFNAKIAKFIYFILSKRKFNFVLITYLIHTELFNVNFTI